MSLKTTTPRFAIERATLHRPKPKMIVTHTTHGLPAALERRNKHFASKLRSATSKRLTAMPFRFLARATPRKKLRRCGKIYTAPPECLGRAHTQTKRMSSPTRSVWNTLSLTLCPSLESSSFGRCRSMLGRRKTRSRVISLVEWLHRVGWWADVSTRLAPWRRHRNSCLGCWSFGRCHSTPGHPKILFRVISSAVSRRRCDWSADAWTCRASLHHRRTLCFGPNSSSERPHLNCRRLRLRS